MGKPCLRMGIERFKETDGSTIDTDEIVRIVAGVISHIVEAAEDPKIETDSKYFLPHEKGGKKTVMV